MGSFQLFLLFIIIFFPFQPSISVENCRIQCGSQSIHFPFRLIDQPDYCSYRGFKLSCEGREKQGLRPILTLPCTGNFSVYQIDYAQQILRIEYPEGCIPGILLFQGLNLSGSPFASALTRSYTFFNCSNHAPMLKYRQVTKILCLSGLDFDVVATPTDSYIPPTSLCSEIGKVSVPNPPTDWSVDLNYGITLGWTDPDCRWCESHRGTCLRGNVSDDLDVECSGAVNSGLSTSAQFALLFGVATPIVCLLAIISCHRIKFIEPPQNHPNPEILMSITLPRSTSDGNGLDRRTIDAYPTTLLDQSRCLPNPNDNTCSICLCEYQAHEALRTIPNCNHYFHVDCIDQWLKLNATCPICRDKF